LWILCVLIWIAIAFWPARVAGRKGHSFIGYFIFSLFFFPAALIVAYLVPPRVVAVQGERDEPGVEGRGVKVAERDGSEVVAGGEVAQGRGPGDVDARCRAHFDAEYPAQAAVMVTSASSTASQICTIRE